MTEGGVGGGRQDKAPCGMWSVQHKANCCCWDDNIINNFTAVEREGE